MVQIVNLVKIPRRVLHECVIIFSLFRDDSYMWLIFGFWIYQISNTIMLGTDVLILIFWVSGIGSMLQ